MNTSDVRVGFIGLGSMASAICDGMLLKGAVKPENIYASARNQDKLKANCEARGINACTTAELIEASDIIVVAVLPQTVPAICSEHGEALKGKIIVNVAYGVGFDDYEKYLPAGCNHISTVPNTPVSVGEGIFVCEDKHTFTDEQLAVFKEVFGKIALLEFVSSPVLDLGGIIAGSTPAFMAQVAEALADAAVKHGMTRPSAYRLVQQMMCGTAKYMLETGIHPGELKDGVCSPGGATIKGVAALEKAGIRDAFIQAIDDIME